MPTGVMSTSSLREDLNERRSTCIDGRLTRLRPSGQTDGDQECMTPLDGGRWSNDVQVHPSRNSRGPAEKVVREGRSRDYQEIPYVEVMEASYWQQLKALLWRNAMLKRRNVPALLSELLFPVYMTAIIAMIKAFSTPEVEPGIVFPVNDVYSPSFGYPMMPGMQILASPNSSQHEQLIQQVISKMNVTSSYRMFATETDAQNYYEALSDTERLMVAAGVVLDYEGVSNSYALRVSSRSIPSTTDIRDGNPGRCRDKNGTDIFNCPVNQYLGTAFVQLQIALDNVIMESLGVTGTVVDSRRIQVQMMDKDEYEPVTTYLQSIAATYISFSFIFLVGFLTTNIVAEKEKKIKVGMMMMGLRSSVFWLSWTIIYLALVLVASALLIAILLASDFFSNSNYFLMFIALVLYGTSCMGLAFLISPFFDKAKSAGGFSGLVTLVLSVSYLGISLTREENSYNAKISPGVQWFLCLFSPIAFSSFVDQAVFLDIKRDGFDFDSSLDYGDFPLLAPLLMLVVDTVLYFLLAAYFDKVVPGEYGLSYHPLFFLQPSFWCASCSSQSGEKQRLMKGSERSAAQSADVEPVAANYDDKVAMRVNSLTKIFKVDRVPKKVVDDFCLDIYEGHITCLLGHNGAGKTTLINMLTGVLPATQGNATIMGLDVSNPRDMERIRTMCGICPQHNILYDSLSCREHLKIFGNIKGVPPSDLPQTIENTLQDVDLVGQEDTLAKNLSGGQKRKLSVAIALIGNPKLIFLDEPTAGMDPFSRRHLWSLLKKRREGRVILLTTHFMDEADILSDRKAFISHGKLRCCGSSLFLKNKFGLGYHLTMVVAPDCDVHNVTRSLQAIIPSVELERSHGKEIAYTIPLSDVSQFSSLFGLLDESSKDMGIKSYGVSMTTLEEVFLKLENSSSHEDQIDDGTHLNAGFGDGDQVNLDLIGQRSSTFGAAAVKGKALTRQKIKALLRLRCIMFFTNFKFIFIGFFLPTAMAVAGLVVLKLRKAPSLSDSNVTPLTFDPLMYTAAGTDYEKNPMLIFDATNNPLSANVISGFRSQVAVDEKIGTAKDMLDITPHNIGMQMDALSSGVLTNFVALYNYSALHSIPTLINMATNSILRSSNIGSNVTAASLPWPDDSRTPTYNTNMMMSSFLLGFAFIYLLTGFVSEIVQDREWKLRGQLRISGVGFNIYWGTLYIVDLLIYLVPCTIIIIVLLAIDIEGMNTAGPMSAVVLWFLTNMPFNILMVMNISFLFDKAETASSYLPTLLQLAGMLPYFTVSMIDMITQSNWAIILHYVFCFVSPPYLLFGGFYFITRIGFYASFTGENVTTSDYFKPDSHILVTILAPLFHFLWMYWLLRVLDIRRTGGNPKEAFPCMAKQYDSSSHGSSNTDLIEDEDDDVAAERQRVEKMNPTESVRYTRTDGVNGLDTKCVAYTSKLRKEFEKRTKRSGSMFWKKKPKDTKIKVAVRSMSIGVEPGEVLGLLGPNGAGKSTALNMVTAETAPTCGKVVVSGHNVRSNTLSVLESLGYCPQHDALWETITLEEHIRCFAAIKGVHPSELERVIDFYVDNLKLGEHRKKHAKKLSGGTKRKLSYIMSMLGSPRLVLMDEPSTGMDPQSKRFFWDTIKASFKDTDRGAILTTHYMEEADALCDRVGIMINGALECLGSTQHLKNKYGSGYILEVKLAINPAVVVSAEQIESLMDSLEDHLKTLFPDMDTVERFMERAQYSIPQHNVKSLGATFSSLEQCKITHSLEEYSFSQSSLEQVFLFFAKRQLEEGQDDEDKAKLAPRRQTSQSSPQSIPV